MKFNIEKDKCSACMACYNICPKKCISMQYDEYGILYPVIDEEKCTHCGLCNKVCQINQKSEFRMPMHTYASWSKDYEDRVSSSSGAMASIFYKYIIEKSGIAIGVSYDENMQLVYSYSDTKEDLLKYKGSKYSHSFIGEIYKKIKYFLEIGKEVLFVGTPCQVDGLKKFLLKSYENLITIDIICHGMPSQKYLDEYIEEIEKTVGKKVTNLTFRGRENFKFTLYNDKEIIYSKPSNEDNYFYGFLSGIFYRDSCYKCKYARKERVSDITIGDFWEIGKNVPFEHKDKDLGVSVVLINTEKGKKLFDKCKGEIYYEERTLEEAIYGNEQLRNPSKRHAKNELFKEMYKNHGFIEAIKDIK